MRICWLSLLAIGLSACAGGLDDPARFLPDGAVDLCPSGTDVETDIFLARCGSSNCHDDDAPANGVDLITPGLMTRLSAQTAVGGCAGEPILVVNDPGSSVLYKRTIGTSCGSQMPLGETSLTMEELDCLRAWILTSTTGTGG